jgi:hypothetical protein
LLLWLTNKLRPEQIHNVVTAEIPNKDEDPVLYDPEARHMIDRPYGALNFNGKCSRTFSRPFQSLASTGGDAYPNYRQ